MRCFVVASVIGGLSQCKLRAKDPQDATTCSCCFCDAAAVVSPPDRQGARGCGVCFSGLSLREKRGVVEVLV